MKTSIKLFTLIFSLLTLSSCDKEPDPIIAIPSDNEKIIQYFPGFSGDYDLNPEFGTNTNTDRQILIEDYTGHLCANCPAAAVVAKGIEDKYPGIAHVVSVHQGPIGSNFQNPYSSNNPKYPHYSTDFRTDIGIESVSVMSDIIGNPAGMISRTATGDTGNPLKIWNHIPNSWEGVVDGLVASNDNVVNVQLIHNFYPETKGLFVHYQVEALSNLDENTKIIVWVIEKEVVADQLYPSGVEDEFYKHHNVLSGGVTSAFGESIGSLTSGEKLEGLVINGLNEMNTVRAINNDGGNDLTIFALVINSETQEILQVTTQDVSF